MLFAFYPVRLIKRHAETFREGIDIMQFAALEKEALIHHKNFSCFHHVPSEKQREALEIIPRKNPLKGIILGTLFSLPLWAMIAFIIGRVI